MPILLYAPASNPILPPFALVPLLPDIFPTSMQHKDHLTLKTKKRKMTWSHVGFTPTRSMALNLSRSLVNVYAVPPPSLIVSGVRRPSLDILPMNAPCGRLVGGASPLTTHTTTAQCHTRPANLGGVWSGSTTTTSVRGVLQDPLLPWSMK